MYTHISFSYWVVECTIIEKKNTNLKRKPENLLRQAFMYIYNCTGRHENKNNDSEAIYYAKRTVKCVVYT